MNPEHIASSVNIIRSLTETPGPEGLSPEQLEIWDAFERAKIKALRKNADYVFTPPELCPSIGVEGSILVRLSDKWLRLKSLLSRPKRESLVADEALIDTVSDMGTYFFLWSILLRKSPEQRRKQP